MSRRTLLKTTEETKTKVANIVRNALEKQYGDELVFDPITVIPKIDHEGDEYLHVYIVYDGDRDKMDPGWTVGLSGLILDGTTEEEIFRVPGTSFVEKSEWEEDSGARVLNYVPLA